MKESHYTKPARVERQVMSCRGNLQTFTSTGEKKLGSFKHFQGDSEMFKSNLFFFKGHKLEKPFTFCFPLIFVFLL